MAGRSFPSTSSPPAAPRLGVVGGWGDTGADSIHKTQSQTWLTAWQSEVYLLQTSFQLTSICTENFFPGHKLRHPRVKGSRRGGHIGDCVSQSSANCSRGVVHYWPGLWLVSGSYEAFVLTYFYHFASLQGIPQEDNILGQGLWGNNA